MKRSILTVIALVSVSMTVHARLGETVDEIAKRHGAPTTGLYPVEYSHREFGDAQAWYEKSDVKLLVVFKNGVSQWEQVVPKDPNTKLTHSEIQAFLDANVGDSLWLPPKESPTGTRWERKDGGVRALLAPDKKTLTVVITKGGNQGF